MQSPATLNDFSEDWIADDATVAEDERECTARERMASAVGQLVVLAVPAVSAVLVVVRGPSVPTGFMIGGSPQREPLDRVVLAEILSVAHDDRVAATMARLVLGQGDEIELCVARNDAGEIQGVIVARFGGGVAQNWLRQVLGRAGASLVGWQAAMAPWPSQALLDAIAEPVIAHEHGIVLAANAAVARCLDRAPLDIAGTTVASITRQLQPLRRCTVMIGGCPRPAIVFDGSARSRPQAELLEAVDRVVSRRYSLVRQVARIAIDRREHAAVALPAAQVEDVLSIALLDLVAFFVTRSAQNQIQISVENHGHRSVIELAATGSIFRAPDIEHIGAVVCGSRVRSLGGELLLDTAHAERRVIRISFPGAK